MFLPGSISLGTNLLTPTSDKKREVSPAHPADSKNFPFLISTGLFLPLCHTNRFLYAYLYKPVHTC